MTTSSTRPTPLMTRLNNDWASIADREDDYGTLGTRAGGELLAQIRTTSGEAQDRVLYELVCLTHAGHSAAERVLVQALVPAAQRMANRVRTLDDFDRSDRVGYAIGAAWESIKQYKRHLHRRVMANLTMNMLGILAPDKTANDRIIADNTIAVSSDILEAEAGTWEAPEAPAEVMLARLFTWASDFGILTRDEIALLSRAALGDDTHATIAAELGVTVACLRKRVDRIRGRLAAAAREQF